MHDNPTKKIDFTACLLAAYALAQLAVVSGHAFAFAGAYSGNAGITMSDFPGCGITFRAFLNIAIYTSVPSFFVISGYLFFNNFNGLRDWSGKLKRRLKSLLGPYLIWNIIASPWMTALILPLASIAIPTLGSARHASFAEVFIGEYPGFYPANGSLWYIQQLMLMVIMAPLIWAMVRSRWALFFLGAMMCGWSAALAFTYGGVENFSEALFCFSTGAYLGLNRKNLFSIPRHTTALLAAVVLVGAFLPVFWAPCYLLTPALSMLGCMLMFGLAKALASTRYMPWVAYLGESALFVYLAHTLGSRQIAIMLFSRLQPQNEFEMFCTILAFICLTLVIWLSIYAMLRKFAPRTLNFLTGGRVRSRCARPVRTEG